MALAIVSPAKLDGRIYPQLPKGMYRWTTKSPSGTGTVAGTTTSVNIDFNPDLNEDFQPYVSLSTVQISTRVAALTILGVRIKLQATDFEDQPTGTVRTIGAFNMRNYAVATTYSGHYDHPAYLGRVVKGTLGRMVVELEEVDTTVYESWATGFWSDKPFIVPHYLRP